MTGHKFTIHNRDIDVTCVVESDTCEYEITKHRDMEFISYRKHTEWKNRAYQLHKVLLSGQQVVEKDNIKENPNLNGSNLVFFDEGETGRINWFIQLASTITSKYDLSLNYIYGLYYSQTTRIKDLIYRYKI